MERYGSRSGLRRGVQSVAACRKIAFLADGIGETFWAQGNGARHFLRQWYDPL